MAENFVSDHFMCTWYWLGSMNKLDFRNLFRYNLFFFPVFLFHRFPLQKSVVPLYAYNNEIVKI